MSYCLQALQLFMGMEQQRFMAVISEVATKPQTLPGSWCVLALACLIHLGMKRLMPNEESGLGIGPEYKEALRLHGR